ncbi:hypothetical protein lerEdw1_007960 [Lerista edwardsae]|nr:hypothetical protein lerEdw1_007960 [Lerista edwardsae]
MAWPCISRVCCLARFWNQLDKSDLAVPLTIHNYSDIEEPAEEGAEAGGGAPQQQPRIPTGGSSGSRPQAYPRAAPALPVSASAPSLQDSLVGVKRPSKKAGGGGGGHRKEPFAAETQYRQDFRAWPVQKRDVLPWIGEHEYRPWTGAKRSRPTKTKQGFIIPEDHFVQESSYKADFKIPEVKAKFSPNPSAVFQAPSRILNV